MNNKGMSRKSKQKSWKSKQKLFLFFLTKPGKKKYGNPNKKAGNPNKNHGNPTKQTDQTKKE
jgi:hypothetical protein